MISKFQHTSRHYTDSGGKETQMKKIRTIEAAVLEEKKLRVCAYVRVSTDQAEQKNSFSAQVEHYTAYIKNNPAWNFAGIYADEALSGKNTAKRPEFMRMVLSSVAEEELNSISQNMHWAYQRRFKQGKIRVNTTRFLGYDKDKNGSLIINEEQASIVRRIFNDYLSGLGISRIAKGLDGIKTISGKVKWAESTVRDIIKNEKYVGDALLQKTITKDFKKKRNKGEVPMYYVKDSHPAIITREDFEKAQELMVERAKSKGNINGTREKYLKRYAFTGTIECGHCGKTYKRHIDNCGNVAESACWVCSAYI